jgi:hypothetical protein
MSPVSDPPDLDDFVRSSFEAAQTSTPMLQIGQRRPPPLMPAAIACSRNQLKAQMSIRKFRLGIHLPPSSNRAKLLHLACF